MSRRSRQIFVGSSIVAAAAALSLVAVSLAGSPGAAAPPTGEMPGRGGAHMEQLLRAAPGDMVEEGPGQAADAAFHKRAYPTGTISMEQMDRARASFAAAQARSLPDGSTSSAAWTPAGPSRPLYPFTEFRDAFSYVPNEYVAGGRTTSIAISHVCDAGDCRAWITPAGGGVWSTDDILADDPEWTYLGGPLEINAAGSVSIDRNDPTGQTIYVGTGEANICASGCVAGVGLYKSTDGGATWTGPIGKDELGGKGIGEIIVEPDNPDTIYVATTTALRGMTGVCCTGVTRPVPDAEKWGLYKTTDGGDTWSFIHNGSEDATECTGSAEEFANTTACSPRGVRHLELDPNDSETLYASSYARGIWRSTDAGDTWEQIKESLNPAIIQTRAAFDVTELANGDTRMYVYEGNNNTQYSRLFRSDDVATGTPEFTDLTSANPADPGFATYNQCTAQCWYDIFVHTPDGYPDMVYTGGSYVYGETVANKRGVVLSTDAGVSGTDMTFDGTDELHPNGIHPDQHDLVTNPNNPYQFFETGDGGVVRSSGDLVDRAEWCDDPRRNLSGPSLERCEQMLSAIPGEIKGINNGLATLQFVHLAVSPHDSSVVTGGTQDNGTWDNYGETTTWINTIIGDGGWAGFDVEVEDFRFHNFTGASPEVNFSAGDIGEWIWTGDPLAHGGEFYSPVISDPVVSGTMFAGTAQTVFRTTTFGLGDRTLEEAQEICNRWNGTFAEECGDWAPTGPTNLTDAAWGDRAGGNVAAIERTTADTGTAWAATTTGRLFMTHNIDADDPADVEWIRLDDDVETDPNRFISGIYINPKKPNRALVSYSGFDQNTPDTPGHLFRVRYVRSAETSEWRLNVDRGLGDLPVNDVVRDTTNRNVYIATDFGILTRQQRTWVQAGEGIPNVEVAQLTISPDDQLLYAATHGLSAWRLPLGS